MHANDPCIMRCIKPERRRNLAKTAGASKCVRELRRENQKIPRAGQLRRTENHGAVFAVEFGRC